MKVKPTTIKRLLAVGVVLMALPQLLFWAFGALVTFTFADFTIDGVHFPHEHVVTQQSFGLAMFAVLGINVAALIAFLASRHGIGWWFLVIVQASDYVVVSVIGYETGEYGSLSDFGWQVASASAAIDVLLLLGLHQAMKVLTHPESTSQH